MRMSRLIIPIIVIILFLSNTIFAAALIIANNSVVQSSINKDDIKLVFLGKKKKWDDGKKIRVVALREGNTHEEILKLYVNKTPSKFKSYWKMVIVSGTGRPPKFLKSEAELVKYVAEKEGAIGYISENTSLEGCKILSIK